MTLENIKPRTVFIDPGRRDLLYCMHQDSISEAPLTCRYTRNTKAIDTKSTQYKKLRQRIKTNEVKACEAKLSKHPAATVYIPKFLLYMKTRCEVSAIMSRHYQSLIYRKLRFRSYLYKKQADDKLAKAIRDQFGEDPVLVIGNWSAWSSTMNKYHEPAQGIGLLRMLRNKVPSLFNR